MNKCLVGRHRDRTVGSVVEQEHSDFSLAVCEPTNFVHERDKWSHPIQFILSLIGYAVGLGNIWRFPYVVMENGGGAFLIPYIIFILTCGISMCYMEFTLGQFTGLSPVRAFNFAPIFKGIGWAMFTVSGVICIYYNILMAWVFYYFGMSFQWELPWKSCNNSWNTPNCISYDAMAPSLNSSISVINKTSSTEEFWLHNVLEISEGISTIGGINWKLLLCMMASWILTFLCLMKGIKSSGKVVYITALLPYIFLTIILIRGVTLPGSLIGLEFYIKPNWSRLAEIKLWSTAAVQVFYNLGPAWGGLITMSSYNQFHKKYNRDAIILPLIACGTNIYGGLAIFSMAGNMVYEMGGDDVAAVMKSGPGLAFIVYPAALLRLPGAAIWTVLFFAMLLTLGLDSQFATLETMTSGLIDQFPSILGKHKTIFTFIVCLVQFLLGMILVTRAGSYYFQVLDWYATPVSIIVIALVEVFCISYVYVDKILSRAHLMFIAVIRQLKLRSQHETFNYLTFISRGAGKLFQNATMMLGQQHKISRIIWLSSWYVVAPGFIVIIMISIFLDYTPPKFTNGEPFPEWAKAVGWLLASISLIPLPLVAIVELVNHRHHLQDLFHPTDYWLKAVAQRQELAKLPALSAEVMESPDTSKVNEPEILEIF